MLLGLGQIVGHHLFAHLMRRDLRHPTQLFLGLGRVTQQGFDLGGAEVARVDFYNRTLAKVAHLVHALTLPGDGHAQLSRRPFDELAHGVLLAGGNHKVFRAVLLQHQPLHAHIVLGVTPVAQGVDIAHVQAIFQILADIGQAARDLARDKGLAASRAFVVKQNAVAGVQAIGFAVVDRDPVGVHLGHRIGAARVEGRGFRLWNFLHQAVQLAGTCLIEAGLLLQPQDADGFQQAQRAQAVYIGGVFGRFK